MLTFEVWYIEILILITFWFNDAHKLSYVICKQYQSWILGHSVFPKDTIYPPIISAWEYPFLKDANGDNDLKLGGMGNIGTFFSIFDFPVFCYLHLGSHNYSFYSLNMQ